MLWSAVSYALIPLEQLPNIYFYTLWHTEFLLGLHISHQFVNSVWHLNGLRQLATQWSMQLFSNTLTHIHTVRMRNAIQHCYASKRARIAGGTKRTCCFRQPHYIMHFFLCAHIRDAPLLHWNFKHVWITISRDMLYQMLDFCASLWPNKCVSLCLIRVEPLKNQSKYLSEQLKSECIS